MANSEIVTVPVAPNESWINGRIVKVESTQEGVGAVWFVEILKSIDISNAKNFTKNRISSTIPILVHPGVDEAFEPGTIIEARIAYQGDERGGAFFIMGRDVKRILRAEVAS